MAAKEKVKLTGKPLADAMEAAMSAAVLACAKAGITDPNKVRAAMLKARREVKDAN